MSIRCLYSFLVFLKTLIGLLGCVCFELNLSCETQEPEGDHVLTF